MDKHDIFDLLCFFSFLFTTFGCGVMVKNKKSMLDPPSSILFLFSPVEVKSSSQYHQNCYLTTTSLIFGQKPWINGQTWVSDTQCKTLMTFCTMSTFLISLKWLSRRNSQCQNLVNRFVTVFWLQLKFKKWNSINQDILYWLQKLWIFWS